MIWEVFFSNYYPTWSESTFAFTFGGILKSTLYNELYLMNPALFISSICIFLFNYFVSFKKCDKKQRFKFAVNLQ